MPIENFIAELENNIVGIEPGSLQADTRFRDLSCWDSLAVLTTLATYDACFGRQLTASQLATCTTVRDIFELAQK